MNIGTILGLLPAFFGVIQQIISLFHTGTLDTSAVGTDAVAVLTGLGVVHTSNQAASATLVANAAQAAVVTSQQAIAAANRSKG